MTRQRNAQRAVLWDLDGTLIDSEPLWHAAETAFLIERGLQWSELAAQKLLGANLSRMAEVMEQETGVRFQLEELESGLLPRLIDGLRQKVPFRPGAETILKKLAEAGVPQALVTSSSRSVVSVVLDALPTAAAALPGRLTCIWCYPPSVVSASPSWPSAMRSAVLAYAASMYAARSSRWTRHTPLPPELAALNSPLRTSA